MEGSLREGQRLFDELLASAPAVAELIRGGPCDPFYDDTRVPAFLREVRRLSGEVV